MTSNPEQQKIHWIEKKSILAEHSERYNLPIELYIQNVVYRDDGRAEVKALPSVLLDAPALCRLSPRIHIWTLNPMYEG